jgi:uncharacterized lipoprotein YbaY
LPSKADQPGPQNGKLSIPLPFDAAVKAALKVKPLSAPSKQLGKRAVRKRG